MDERRRKRSRRHGAAACAALVFALSALLVPAGAVSAPDLGGETQLLVPVGKAIGVKLFAEGVLVVGLSENEGAVSPAKKGGMKAGDLILTMNDVTIGSTEHLQSLLAENGEREAAFGVRRGGRLVKLAVCPKKGQDGVCRLGAWIRDSMAGIGTVTFYDPQTGAFAALGHGITDVDTGKLMPLSRGSVMAASVKAVKRGASGSPGELRGDFDLTRDLGLLYANTECGIFGVLPQENRPEAVGEAIPVARRTEVRTGKAVILANCRGDEVCAYEIEIEKLYGGSAPTRNLLLRVTDPALIALTGGIVQGIGHTLMEDVTRTPKGAIRESSLFTYRLPTRLDVGQIDVEFEHSYEPTGPFGAKSIGEIVINTPAPAIAHAIYRATGVWHRELPILPEHILLAKPEAD